MDCKTARSHLSLYLDAALDAPTATDLDRHLTDCATCAAQFEAETQIESKLSAALSQPQMPDALWSQLRSSVNKDALQGGAAEVLPASMPISDTAQPGWKLPVSLAAAAAVAIAVWGYWPSPTQRDYSNFWKTDVASMVAVGPTADAIVDEAEIAALLREQYGLAMATDPSEIGGHRLKIEHAERAEFAGRAGMRIRVKCCGMPVVVALLATEDVKQLPTPVSTVVNKSRTANTKQENLNVGVERVGDYEAIIISEHKLSGMRKFLKLADA